MTTFNQLMYCNSILLFYFFLHAHFSFLKLEFGIRSPKYSMPSSLHEKCRSFQVFISGSIPCWSDRLLLFVAVCYCRFLQLLFFVFRLSWCQILLKYKFQPSLFSVVLVTAFVMWLLFLVVFGYFCYFLLFVIVITKCCWLNCQLLLKIKVLHYQSLRQTALVITAALHYTFIGYLCYSHFLEILYIFLIRYVKVYGTNRLSDRLRCNRFE